MEPNQSQPMTSQPTTPPPTTPPTMNTSPITPTPTGPKKMRPVVGILVVILVVILGALYIFASKSNSPAIPDETAGVNSGANAEVQPVTNTSDNVQDINADLNSATQGLDAQSF